MPDTRAALSSSFTDCGAAAITIPSIRRDTLAHLAWAITEEGFGFMVSRSKGDFRRYSEYHAPASFTTFSQSSSDESLTSAKAGLLLCNQSENSKHASGPTDGRSGNVAVPGFIVSLLEPALGEAASSEIEP